jgi:patatin-like phospholipase
VPPPVKPPEVPERAYSTRLRTAVVLTGSGTSAAYHAGVLRALHEAGLKIDLVAGRGAGAIGAFFAAVDGGAKLWDSDGIWRSRSAARFYGWRPPLRIAGWALVVAGVVFAVPLALLVLAIAVGTIGLLLTLVGLEGPGSLLRTSFSAWVDALFAPAALPTIIPRLVLFALLVGFGALAAGVVASSLTARVKRRRQHGTMWRLIGSPLTAAAVVERSLAELWNLIRGAAPLAAPPASELGRKYVELLSDNLGQPGFRELLVTVHDMDTRRDLVFAMLDAAHRQRFFGRPGTPEHAGRALEAFDLTGIGRDHALDALAGALALPVATEPHLTTFSPEGPWRGETHRVCDRPGSLTRLLHEVALAGAEQVILVSASAPPGRAHELKAGRGDLRGRAGEQLGAFEAAGLRDVLDQFDGRFSGLFVIRPAHNPLGPLDFRGVYDERSDRTLPLAELTDRGYGDAYRQFIEPVVGAGGERIETVQSSSGAAGRSIQL